MGNKFNKEEFYERDPGEILKDLNRVKNKKFERESKSSFEFISIIGKGGFGKVWKVFYKKKRTQYALKEMSKAKIIDKHSEESVKYERDLLSRMNHP